MNIEGTRLLIYSALFLVCSAIGALLGVAAGIWSLVQIVAVIELTYWIGTINSDRTARHW